VDGSFNPAIGAGGYPYGVSSVVVQSDGKVLIGGGFTAVNGTNRISIARLNANGSLDSSFIPGAGVYGYAVVVALQPDGKVLIGGAYSIVNGTNHSGIVRLNANGSLDSSFDPGTGDQSAAPFALQPDGRCSSAPISTPSAARTTTQSTGSMRMAVGTAVSIRPQ